MFTFFIGFVNPFLSDRLSEYTLYSNLMIVHVIIHIMIIIYTKTGCPWCHAALEWLSKKEIPFEERNTTEHPEYMEEMQQATQQTKAPTLLIDGVWLPDAGVEDIAKALGVEL